MKTTSTIKHLLLALTIMVSVTACKKDKKDPEPTPPVEVKAITLTDLKALSTAASVKVPDAKKITGIIISDASGKNIDSKSIVLQDAGSQTGIIIGFDAAPTFAAGDQVEVNISNQTLAQVNGEVILQNIPTANAKKLGTGAITAKTTTVAEIITNKMAWDGTLVTIAATDLTGGNGKYSGTLTIKDASGTVTSNIMAAAAFENTAYPVSVSAVTGIVRINGNDVRVDIRKTSDVATGSITRIITEDFSNMTSLDPGEPFFSQGFTTAIGIYSSNALSPIAPNAWTSQNMMQEGNFLTSGRTYCYLTSAPDFSNALPCGYNNLTGLKNISITWAQSQAKTLSFTAFGNSATIPLDSFDPSIDYTQVAVKIPLSKADGSGLLDISTGLSPKYTAAGKFYTYTFTLPTKDQLVAAGADPTAVDEWLINPQFSIYNISSPSMIVFDKIVLGFDK